MPDCKSDHRQILTLSVLTGMLALVVASIVILAAVPPVSRDALTHHLAVPKLYLKHGGIYEIPDIAFSYYPMNLDLLYLVPLYFGNDIIPKYIHFLFALLTACLIYQYLSRRLGANWGLLGALFFLSLPIIVKLSITVYVDMGLIFFSTASIISLLKWIDSRFQLKFLILSGVSCGLALGTKYNGLIVLFLLSLLIPVVFISESKKKLMATDSTDQTRSIKIQLKALGSGAIFLILALLIFSPWMIRNYVWKANPVYPLYNHVFNRPIPVTSDTQTDRLTPGQTSGRQRAAEAKSSSWGPFALRKVIYGESWWEIALIPVRIFFQGQDNDPRYFDGKLNPFLFLLPFFSFFLSNGSPSTWQTEKKIFAFFAIFFVLYAFSQTSIRIRYIAPIIPPLVILAIFGFYHIVLALNNRWKKLPNWFSPGLIILLGGALLAYNAGYFFQQFNHVKPLSYLSGQMSRDEYIAQHRPEYAVFQYVNENLPGNAKILGLFLGKRRYYSDRKLIFGENKFKQAVNRADSGDSLLNVLRRKEFSHLIIRYDLFHRWADTQFDDRKKQLLKNFFADQVRHILAKGGYVLFELRHASNSGIRGLRE